jgi:magnesium transporter
MDQTATPEVNGFAKPTLNDTKTCETNGEVRKKAVCVTLPSGPKPKPIKIQGDKPQEFLPFLQSSVLTWVNYSVKDLERDGTDVAVAFGFSESLIPALMKGYFANFEDRDVELGMLLPAVRVKKVDFACFPLIILVKKSLILTIHQEDVFRLVNFSRYAEVYMRKFPENMPAEDKLTLMLYRIIDENNNRNFEQLREIEDQADWLSESLVDPKSERELLGRNIYEMKHTLITYLNTLWRTLDVLNNLRYGDADVITDNPKVLAKINLMVEDVTQQISLSEHMSEVLASGLEVLQSIYNNQLQVLNNRMALAMTWLTILGTAVLVPNTLATIGGMIPMDDKTLIWFLMLIGIATIESTALAWWWVSRKVNIPVKADEYRPIERPLKKGRLF